MPYYLTAHLSRIDYFHAFDPLRYLLPPPISRSFLGRGTSQGRFGGKACGSPVTRSRVALPRSHSMSVAIESETISMRRLDLAYHDRRIERLRRVALTQLTKASVVDKQMKNLIILRKPQLLSRGAGSSLRTALACCSLTLISRQYGSNLNVQP